jgi:hypothetical protein
LEASALRSTARGVAGREKPPEDGRAAGALDHDGEEVEIVEAVPCVRCAAVDR